MSGTAPAWQAREMQRQQFLDGIFSQFYETDELDLNFLIRFCLVQIQTEMLTKNPTNLQDSREVGEVVTNPKAPAAHNHICVPINNLADVMEEKLFLVGSVLKKLVEMVTYDLQHKLHKIELQRPKKIFGVDDRMRKVHII